MPEAWCVSCLHPTSPMVVCGWGVCKHCRKMPRLDYSGMNQNIHSANGRDLIRRSIRAYLNKQKEGAA